MVSFDNEWIINTYPNGDEEKIRWDDLEAIYFETKNQDSTQEDMVTIIVGKRQDLPVLRLSNDVEGVFEFLCEMLDRFPDCDYDQYIDAISSRENKKYLIWKAKN